jgi:hypothetical protein
LNTNSPNFNPGGKISAKIFINLMKILKSFQEKDSFSGGVKHLKKLDEENNDI